MEKLFKVKGKIHYYPGDSKIELESQLSSYYLLNNRRIVRFEIAGVSIVALCTIPNAKKIPSRITLNDECVLFSGILYKENKKENVQEEYDITIEGSIDFLLQLLEQEPYLTEEQRNKILKLKSE